jgi:acyl-CoA thioester hydrolase
VRIPRKRGVVLKNPPVVEEIQVRYQDLDPYGHVNNALHAVYFESLRMAYWKRLAEDLDLGPLEAGDIPGARYVIAEATVRYKAPIFLDDALLGAASIRTVGNRSYVMEYELRVGESFEDGRVVAEGESAQVFYDPQTGEVMPRPEWFLPAVAELEGRSEESFGPER